MKIHDFIINLHNSEYKDSEQYFLMKELTKILDTDSGAFMLEMNQNAFIIFAKSACKHAIGYNMYLLTPNQKSEWLYAGDYKYLSAIYQHYIHNDMAQFVGTDIELLEELKSLTKNFTSGIGVGN